MLDLSSFDTSSVQGIAYLFSGCPKLKTVYASKQFKLNFTERVFFDEYTGYNDMVHLVGGLGTSSDSVTTEALWGHDPEWEHVGWWIKPWYLSADTPGSPGVFVLKEKGTKALSDLASPSVSGGSYTGKSVAPSVVLRDGGKTLVQGRDYRILSSSNNLNAGTASAVIEGMGAYSGYKRIEYTIKPASLSGAKVSPSQVSYTYDGSAKTPSVTVGLGGKTLASGTDYTVSYANNVAVGTGRVTVTGKGNYAGTASATFAIKQAALNPGQGGQGSNQGSQGANQGSQGSNQGGQGSGSAGLKPGEGTPVAAPAGSWRQDSTGWWYAYAKGGYPANSWSYIGGKWYRFGPSGYMLTGWALVDGKWYYLDPSGAMAEGWRYVGGEWYWLRPVSGAMATGWVDVDGTWYWMRGSGAMDHSGWLSVGGEWYWLEDSGAMATGWKHVGGEWYYLKPSGAMATGWAQVGGTWYYLDGSGAMATGWRHVGGAWYYLYGSGAMAANAWVDGVYWVGPSGAMATSSWVDGGRYYVGPDGVWQP